MKFQIVLGNVMPRKGHRHDCAQVEVTVLVEADNKADALRKVGKGLGEVIRHQVNSEMIGTATAVQV